MPLQPTEVKNPSSNQEDSQDQEEEQTEAPVGRGRTSRELRQILRDAETSSESQGIVKGSENSQTGIRHY